MDEEIKGIAELEQALADQCTGEVGEMSEPVVDKLKLASDSLNELVEIKGAIVKEGVSQEDIRSVFTVIKRLNDAGIECGVSVGLEEHEIGHFTANRTMVNQRVSQEGIGDTIVSVIRVLLEKLVEYVVGTVRWFKILGAKDKAVDAAFDKAKAKTKDVQEAIALFRRYSMANNSDIETNALAYAKELLLNGSLPRNYVTLAALFHQMSIDEIKTIHKKTERSCLFLRQSVKSLKMFLAGPSADLNIDVTMMEDLATVRQQIADMQVIDPDVKFLTLFIKPEIFADSTVRKQAEPLAKYEYILKAYFSVADELRTIRKINLDSYDDQGVAFINEVIAELTTAFEDLGLVVNFFATVKATQMSVFKIQLNYLNRYASLLYLNARDSAVHEATKVKVQGVFDDLEKKLKSYGI
jgi:hypothetical protein